MTPNHVLKRKVSAPFVRASPEFGNALCLLPHHRAVGQLGSLGRNSTQMKSR